MVKKIDFCFLGSSRFSLFCFKKILKKFSPSLVITLPAKPQKRGLKIEPNIIYSFCLKNKLPVIELKDWSLLKTVQFKFGVIAGFGKIIPSEIFNQFEKGLLNIHPSLLPQYRGPNPIREVILNGDNKTGVTIILTDELVDHGPIIAQKDLLLSQTETYLELEEKLGYLGGELFNDIILDYLADKILPQEQNHSLATFTKKITKNDGLLEVENNFLTWDRKIRALNPWPGTFLKIKLRGEEKILKIFKIEKLPLNAHDNFSKINLGDFFRFKNELGLKISDALIIIKELQLQDRKKMSSKEFLNGYRLEWLKIK